MLREKIVSEMAIEDGDMVLEICTGQDQIYHTIGDTLETPCKSRHIRSYAIRGY